MASDRFIPPGTRVAYHAIWHENRVETPKSEYGVVVHCWLNDEIGMYDCIIAFFGDAFPDGYPTEKPYILRYAAVSLDEIAEG